MNQVISGFSLTNRWLLYTSLMLTPAQLLAGVGSNSPTSVGFLAYNWYNQIVWYIAIKQKQLHALSLLPVYLNSIYVLTYMGGITSGSYIMGAILGCGTAALIVLNTTCAWICWATNMQEGFGAYQFFFFGWRKLTPGWHTFILLWQIADSLWAVWGVIVTFTVAFQYVNLDEDQIKKASNWRYMMILTGPPAVLSVTWPLILWTELIISRNHIVSDTDPIAVYLFIAQVVLMVIPDTFYTGLIRLFMWKRDEESSSLPLTVLKGSASETSDISSQ